MPNGSPHSSSSEAAVKTLAEAKRPIRVVLAHKRDAQPDHSVAELLEKAFLNRGWSVWVERPGRVDMDWAKSVEQQIRGADAVVALLSAESVGSEMLAFRIESANDAAQKQHGHPKIIPVRLAYSGPFAEPTGGILESTQAILWQGEQDNDALVDELIRTIENLPAVRVAPVRVIPRIGLRLAPRVAPQPRPLAGSSSAPREASIPVNLEAVGGAVPLTSEFYLVRPTDRDFEKALARFDSVILIKGARQMGKTSLLARGLQFSRERGAKVALTDFQKLSASNLETVDHLYLTLAESIADQLDLSVLPTDVWDERRGANVNFERFLRREVLAKLNAPLVLGLDEVDRLFLCPFGSEVFGLFRSWHNERALDPSGPWAGLTLAIAYATEAHLFITDMNQSPFNIGTRLTLDDFTREQVAELNRRYRSPLSGEADLDRFRAWVGGHPFLVRRGLHEFVTQKISMADFEKSADQDEGVFGDHLRRMLVLLAKDPELTEVVRGVLKGKPCPTPESFYRLRSAGIILGDSQTDARARCKLYEAFLSRHLL